MTNEYYRFASKSIPPSCLRTTDIANIVSVSRGLLHCRNREFEAATTVLLQSLFDLYPERVVLIDDWRGELTSDAKGEFVPLSDCLCRIHGPTVTPDMRRMLGDGGWVMTFAPETLQTLAWKGPDWSDPAVLQAALSTNPVGCIISSWFDDTDWLIAFSPKIPLPT
jgi:hypothetical protein